MLQIACRLGLELISPAAAKLWSQSRGVYFGLGLEGSVLFTMSRYKPFLSRYCIVLSGLSPCCTVLSMSFIDVLLMFFEQVKC